MKTVGENVDDDILTKQDIFFPKAHMDERKDLETGFIAVGANISLGVGG